MKKRASILLALTAIITGVVCYPINSVTAESTEQALPLTASADRLEYGVLTPGNSYTKTLTITNQEEEDILFSLSVESGEAMDKTSGRSDIIEWITLSGAAEYTLAGGASTNISLRARVPKDAAAGGQYATLVATNTIADYALPLTVISAIIDGDGLEYGGEITASDISWFNLNPEIKSSVSVKNTGNVDFESKSTLSVSSIFGGNPIYENTTSATVYPGTSSAEFHHDWAEAPAIGLYSAAQAVTYVNNNGEIVEHTTERIVIMCPIWLLIIIGVLIIAIIALVIILNIRRKKGKKSPKHNKKPSWEQPEENSID